MSVYIWATIWVTEWRTKFRRDMNSLDNALRQTVRPLPGRIIIGSLCLPSFFGQESIALPPFSENQVALTWLNMIVLFPFAALSNLETVNESTPRFLLFYFIF
jgi:hypothetical protein